jgi:SARP family transcriptional regulator, regulator of embCAB operon
VTAVDDLQDLIRPSGTVKFSLLGPLEVVLNGRVVTPSPPKVREVLAFMLLNVNSVVRMEAIIEELWENNPPRSAFTTVQTYIYQLRKVLGQAGSSGSAELLTKPPGYALCTARSNVDVFVFEDLFMVGRSLLEKGEPAEASLRLSHALSLWKGPALASVTLGRLLGPHATRLEEKRIQALELRVHADMQLGRHRDLIAELKSLVATHPLKEWFHAQLILALYRSGRRGEALQAYQNLWQMLRDELGLEPSQELQRLQREVLAAPASVTGGWLRSASTSHPETFGMPTG